MMKTPRAKSFVLLLQGIGNIQFMMQNSVTNGTQTCTKSLLTRKSFFCQKMEILLNIKGVCRKIQQIVG